MAEQSDITLPFFELKQNALLGHLLINEKFFNLVYQKIKPEWFLGVKNAQLYRLLLKACDRYGRFPKVNELKNSVDFLSMEPKERRILGSFIDLCIHDTAQIRLETIKPELTEWLHSVILMEALKDAEKHFNSKKVKECHTRLMSAVREVSDTTFDGATTVTFSDYMDFLTMAQTERKDALTTGLRDLDDGLLSGAENGALQKGDTTLLMAPVNVGKCLGLNTPVIMYDGSIRMVQDIKKGELLMGPDGLPRTVLSTTTGYGPLYKVVPKNGGDSWVCNDVHVLSLKTGWDNKSHKSYIRKDGSAFTGNYCNEKKGDIVNVPLNEFLEKSKNWRSRHKLWRSSLEFSHKDLLVDPYVLGLWLAKTYASCFVSSKKGLTRWTRTPCNEMLSEIHVLNNKHIPHEYLTSSREQRLALLAGIIDTDGTLTNGQYELTTKLERLANDYAYLARSLGFKVTLSKCKKGIKSHGFVGEYYRLCIRGKLSQVPVKLERKKAKDNYKNSELSSFTVESIGNGDYYGFELDGDHLFLLGDFTVTHNTTAMITMLCHNIRKRKDILFLSHEGRPEDLRLKILANMLGCSIPEIFKLSQTDTGRARLHDVTQIIEKHLVYMPYNKAGMVVEQVVPVIRLAQEQWTSKHDGKGFDLLVDDYPQILGTEQAKKGNLQKRNSDQIVYSNFVQLGLEYNWHNILAIQTNREGSRINRGQGEDRLLTSEDVLESWGPITEATNVITLNRSPEDIKNGVMKYYIVKSRSSETGRVVIAKTDFAKATTHSDTLGSTWYMGSRNNEDKVQELLAQFQQNNDNDGEIK